MGLRSAAMVYQRVTNSVCFMLSQAGCFALSYLDDFMGISTPHDADRHFELSGSLLQALGLQESSQKVCPPSTQMICLGVLFDTVNLTMSVTLARLRELQDAVLPQRLVIQNQPLLKSIYTKPPIISYKRGKSLKDTLVRAKI